MKRRYATIAVLVLFLSLLALQIVSYVHLGGEFTGRPNAVGEADYLWRLRIRIDRDQHLGYISGSVLGVIALLGLLGTRPGHARDALQWAFVPVAFSAASWLHWAMINFGRSDYLDASPIGGITAIFGALSEIVFPIICGSILAKDRPESSTIPANVQARIGLFAGAVLLWTVLFVLLISKYTFAV